MARPKGSKNKKTLAVDFSAALDEKLAKKAELEAEQQKITEDMAALKSKAKIIKKSLTSVEREIAKLEAKKAEADAIRAVQEQKDSLDAAVNGLVARGVSMDDIMAALSKM